MQNFVERHIAASVAVKQALLADAALTSAIASVAAKAVDVYKAGRKVLVAGNGGSAADAQHIAAEFVSRFYFDRPGLPAIALTTDTSILTAVGNDYGFDRLFARQIEANGVCGDMFIGISTSGNSPNIIEALRTCQNMGITRVGLTGQSGGRMAGLCDWCIRVPAAETPRIQEAHILIGHIICAAVEEALFGNGRART